MATTDPNGLVLVDGSDSMQPLHPVLNSITTSVSNAFNEQTRIYPATSLTARTALYTKHGATASKPLFVWYTPAPAGRNLMYTVGGNATSDWKYYSSDADVTQSRIWKVANVTGRTNIFNSVGPGTTSNPVIVWRADAPVGRQLEYNVTNSNVTANWHYVKTSQDVLSGNVSPSGLTGTIKWFKNSTSITVFYDLSGTVSGDIAVASLPTEARSLTPVLLSGSEYRYGGSGNNAMYINSGAIDLRCPAQTGTTRRVGSIVYPVITSAI